MLNLQTPREHEEWIINVNEHYEAHYDVETWMHCLSIRAQVVGCLQVLDKKKRK
jgi:hypothetical protein